MRRAKIVCTLGPATSTEESILALVEAGMDVARLNLSHGSHADHEANYAHVRKASDTVGRAVGILADLQGPKIRTGRFALRMHVDFVALSFVRSARDMYECYCTRREILDEIADAAAAPHGPPGSYPGTCRDLTEQERTARREAGRTPALRLRTDGRSVSFDDRVAGTVTGAVDDVVLRRNDGVPAYNLAVVIDDAAQGVDDVVRGDDLLMSTPRQIRLQQLLDLPRPVYSHVPLVLGADGQRLAKRHGAVTMSELERDGWSAGDVVAWIARSIGLARAGETVTMDRLVGRFDVPALPKAPIVYDARSFAT